MREGAAKAAAFWMLRVSGLLWCAERARRGVPVLAYHGVTAKPDSALGNLRRLHVPQATFEQHLRLLARHWRPIRLCDLVESSPGRAPIPRNAVVVTFDDGYRNFATVAAPLLRRYDVPVTLFVTTGHSGRHWMDRVETMILGASAQRFAWRQQQFDLRSEVGRIRALRTLLLLLDAAGPNRPSQLTDLQSCLGDVSDAPDDDRDLLSWAEVRSLQSEGVDIGAHAEIHDALTRLSPAEAVAAVHRSREVLEREMGQPPFAFSYPFGAFSREIQRAVRHAGFSCAVSTLRGLNGATTERMALKRQLIGADDDVTRLRAALAGLRLGLT